MTFNTMLALFGSNPIEELLSNPLFWIGIGLLIVVIISIRYWKQGGRFALISLLLIADSLLTTYSIIQLDIYYNSQGGIHGAITGIFNTNQIEVVENLSFKLTNIEMQQVSGELYSASIQDAKVLNLEKGIQYAVFVNGSHCGHVDSDPDFISAEYKYAFLDDDKSILLVDTLKIRFAFYKNSTSLTVSTEGGVEAVQYWSEYFNKNEFIVSIQPSTYVKDDEITSVGGDITNYSVVRYYVDNVLYSTDVLSAGSVYTLKTLDMEGFAGWCNEEGQLLGEQIKLTSNLNLYANYTTSYDYTVTYTVNEENIIYPVTAGSKLPTIDNPHKAGKIFLGLSLDGATVLDLSNYIVESNVQFIAVFNDIAGLYSSTNELTTSWEVLVTNGDITVADNVIKDVSTSITGKLLIPNTITEIGSNSFRNSALSEIIIGANVTSIGNYAFANCSQLTKIYIPDNVLSLGNNVFDSCVSLKFVKMSDGLTTVGSGTFTGCSALTDVELSKFFNKITSYMFSGCTSLKTIIIPSNVSTINSLAFWKCSNLESIYIPTNVITINADSYSSSIFYETKSSIVIYCGASEKQEYWDEYWNYYNTTNQLTVKYGYSYEQYLSETFV